MGFALPRTGGTTRRSVAMVRRWMVAVLVMALAPVGLSLSSTASSAGAPGRYIVVLNQSANADAVAGRASVLGATVNALFSSLNTLVVSLAPSRVASLRKDPRVPFVTAARPMQVLDNTAKSTGSVDGVPTGVMRIGAAPLAGVATVE